MDVAFSYTSIVAYLSLGMLVWACVEVGSNDATNLVNAVFGARILNRRLAVNLAAIFVILGASFSSPVLDTMRKEIFDPTLLTSQGAIAVFITAYLVNTVLLYCYSAYGLPVSSTATLVFSLAGGAVGVSGGFASVQWSTLGEITSAIFVSIFLTGLAAFLAQRIFRGAIRKDAQKHDLVVLHGPWITGLILVSLSWFMIVKGMKAVPFVQTMHAGLLSELGTGGCLFLLWAAFTLLTYLLLTLLGRRGSRYLFHGTAIIGMLCMAFAFGQNDLANCASPGLAIWMIWQQGLEVGTDTAIPFWALMACGALMSLGMHTQRAQRVTRAEINTASQQSKVKLYAPVWCVKLATLILSLRRPAASPAEEIRDVAPSASRSASGKKLHYDPLRASVILAVSACIIALASGLGLPISTTYVCFAAVIATGWGDRIFTRGRSELKLGRAIWVVSSWFLCALIAAITAAIAAFTIYHLGYGGLLLAFASNLAVRYVFKQRADKHEAVYHRQQHLKPCTTSPLLHEVNLSDGKPLG